ncbi:MAG: hypothetical protein EP315_02775 [Gammaproteobacteria bacterium]|nr:MAG: hypothetical protein EP315_02775 [Gammaproteobacteria bacterium]
MINKKLTALVFGLAVCMVSVQALADFVFTSPPRESEEKGNETYLPIANFLSNATGEKFVYQYPGTWTDYTRAMKNQEYDLVFDGPHFVSWRIKFINHEAVAKLPQLHIWRIIVRADNSDVSSLDDLVGRKVCAPGAPNFGTLTMMSHYPNPDREPIQVVTKSWKDGFDAVVRGDCDATVLPKTNHKKFDPEFKNTKAIHTHLPYPNQAFTAGPRLTPAMKNKVRNALLSDEGQQALSRLRDRFTQGAYLVSAENEEYDGISMVLKRAGNFNLVAQ